MHIPDGLMAPVVAAIGWGEFALVFAAALFLSGKKLKDRNLPRIAVLSAGIFVAQMIDFPIGGGTTGHLIGGTLMAILVGPSLSILGMTVILVIQALMFGDGGLTALGLNELNMAVIAPLTGWGVFTLLRQSKPGELSRQLAIAAAAWASTIVAASACAAELSVSYAVSAGSYGIAAVVSVPAMLAYHAVIGVGEAAITVGVMAYLARVSPRAFVLEDKLDNREAARIKVFSSDVVKASIAVILVLALALPFYFLYASEGKDGLERTMANAGTEERTQMLKSTFGYGESFFGALFAAILGFLAVALCYLGVLHLVSRLRRRPS